VEINQYENELKDLFDALPIHYKKDKSISDINLVKELFNLYQEEDKEKSNYENTLKDLKLQIHGKSEIQSELDKFSEKRNNLKNQINDKQNHLKELLKDNEGLVISLNQKYNTLPISYKENINIDDKNLDNEFSNLYQEEDKQKNNL